MRKLLKFFICTTFILFASTFTEAQQISSYVFLEVLDSNGKPVADATVETARNLESPFKTSAGGGARIYFSDFKVSKPGYFPFEALGFIRTGYQTHIKLELLKIPETSEERETLGDEQRKRELIFAAKNGDAAGVRRSLESGVSPETTTDDLRGVSAPKNIPAIIFAARSGSAETVEAFLAAGVKLRRRTEPTRSVLAYYLNANLYPYGETRTDAEKALLMKRYAEGVKRLLEAGAETENLNDNQTTALIIAARRELPEIVKILLAAGARIDGKNKYGETALIAATESSLGDAAQIETVNLLLASGADPNSITNIEGYNCRTALMNPAWYGNVAVIRRLIAAKANVNLTCAGGDTPVMFAARQREIEAVKILLAAGADVSGKRGQRTLVQARDEPGRGSDTTGLPEIYKLLEAAGAKWKP